jgi:hypothetical protein
MGEEVVAGELAQTILLYFPISQKGVREANTKWLTVDTSNYKEKTTKSPY